MDNNVAELIKDNEVLGVFTAMSDLLSYATLVAVFVSIFSVAMIQLIKNFFPFRAKFNKAYLIEWVVASWKQVGIDLVSTTYKKLIDKPHDDNETLKLLHGYIRYENKAHKGAERRSIFVRWFYRVIQYFRKDVWGITKNEEQIVNRFKEKYEAENNLTAEEKHYLGLFLSNEKEARPVAIKDILSELAMSNGLDELCGLSPEKLAGQLSIAAQRLLEFQGYVESDKSLPSNNKNDLIRLFYGKWLDDRGINILRNLDRAESDVSVNDSRFLEDMYSQVQRSLDKLMIGLRNSWNRTIRILAMVISFIVILLISNPVTLSKTSITNSIDTRGEWMMVIWCIVVAGYLAPVVHDVLSRLQRNKVGSQ